MIIDAHCHLAHKDWLPMKWWEGLAKLAAPMLEKMGMPGMDTETIIQDVMPGLLFDPGAEKQLAAMDEAGINRAVVFPLDLGVALGEPPVDIETVNRTMAQLGKQHPDRLIPLVTVDPRRPGARDLVKKALEEWGMRGLKLHPGAGFFPNGKEAYRLYESICDKGLPVVVHTGHIVGPLKSRCCDPMGLDDICADFPEMTIVAAHMGHAFVDQVCHMGACKANLWTDISDWQRRAVNEYGHFCRSLRSALDNFGPERVMFGSDGPYMRAVLSDADYLSLIRGLVEKAPQGMSFAEEEIRAVLGGNAARLFGLDSANG